VKVSVVIPTLNEEKNIGILLDELKKYKFIDEIIIVDGYSKDNTVKVADKYDCKVLYDKKGKGSALIKGMSKARGDIIISMDADNSMLPKEIPLLVTGIESGYDVCMGSRFIQGGGTEDMSFVRRIGNKVFVFLVNILFNMDYSDLCYGYRSFSKDGIKKLNLKSNGFGIETEISIKAAKLGLNVIEVPSYEKARKYGQGKLNTISDGWIIMKTIISEISKGEIF
jgi:glycosyltransferase involved in cell wall biosynthesis